MNKGHKLKVPLLLVLLLLYSGSRIQLFASFQPYASSNSYPEMLDAATDTRVQPILFIPNNLTADPTSLSAIDDTMQELRS